MQSDAHVVMSPRAASSTTTNAVASSLRELVQIEKASPQLSREVVTAGQLANTCVRAIAGHATTP